MNELRFWQNKVTSLRRKKRKNYFAKQFEKSSGNSRKTWETINEVLHNGRKQKEEVPVFEKTDSTKVKTKKIEDVNSYFATIGKTMIEEIPNEPTVSKQNNGLQFHLTNTNTAQVQQVIKELKLTKSQGYDELPLQIIKENSADLSEAIAKVINETFETTIIPPEMKVSRITLAFKGGDSAKWENYRAINNMPIVDKIMSKIVNNQLTQHLDLHQILDPHQYSFRRASNTTAALFDLTTIIQKGIDEGKTVLLIFLDITRVKKRSH